MSMVQSDTELESPQNSAVPGYADLLRMAWRRKALIGLGAAVGLIYGALNYAQRIPIYQSSAQVLVVKKRPDVMPSNGMNSVDDYVSTHVALIRSPLVIEQAVEKWELSALKSFTGYGNPTGTVIGGLNVYRDEGSSASSNILTLTYRGTMPDECGMVLNAIIDSYEEFLKETFETENEDTVASISEKIAATELALQEKGKEYQKFRSELPAGWNGTDSNTHSELVKAVQQKQNDIALERIDVESRLARLQVAQEAGKNQSELLAMVKNWQKRADGEGDRAVVVGGDSIVSAQASLEERLLPLALQEKSLLEVVGRDHPDVVSVRRQIEMTRDLYTQLAKASQAAQREKSEADQESGDPVREYQSMLEQRLEDIVDSETKLAEMFEQQSQLARQYGNDEAENDRLRSEITRTEQFYDSLLKHLQSINLGKDLGGYTTQVLSPATVGHRIEPRATPIFSMAILMGLMGGVGLAYAAELFDKRFRTPDEIRRRLQLPLIGHIPFLDDDERALSQIEDGTEVLDPKLVTYYRSRSPDSEAFRGIRTAIYFSTDGHARKVIQFTSPNAGDGKTTVTANLAISIAQSGKQVLVVDADLRKPRVHQVFGISSKVGLATVISGEHEIDEAIQEHPTIANLSILPGGILPPNPAELLTSPRFAELLELLGDRYDFVLVDTPPVLAVTDPCVVAARVDGVVLTITVTKDGRPQAERAREILGGLEANVLGVVVNGVGPESGYGYGNVYGYGYSDRYGQDYMPHDDVSSDDDNNEPDQLGRPDQASKSSSKRRKLTLNGHGKSRGSKSSMWSRFAVW